VAESGPQGYTQQIDPSARHTQVPAHGGICIPGRAHATAATGTYSGTYSG
jgi:hypothetical protein